MNLIGYNGELIELNGIIGIAAVVAVIGGLIQWSTYEFAHTRQQKGLQNI